MRNNIINYATGEPVTTIAVYYDKLVEAVSYFAELIKSGKLRKHIKIEG